MLGTLEPWDLGMGQNINPQNGLLMIVEYQFIDPVHWCHQFDPDSVFPNVSEFRFKNARLRLLSIFCTL